MTEDYRKILDAPITWREFLQNFGAAVIAFTFAALLFVFVLFIDGGVMQ